MTDAVHEELREWRSRPLEAVYPIVYFDALRVKVREEGAVQNKAVHLAVRVTALGHKEILGLWMAENEGAKFWLGVMNELKSRGVRYFLIVVVDGLKGFPEAVEAAFPEATVQTCVVHLIRYSLAHASWKERKELAGALRRSTRRLRWRRRRRRWTGSRRVRGAGSSRRSCAVGVGTGSR